PPPHLIASSRPSVPGLGAPHSAPVPFHSFSRVPVSAALPVTRTPESVPPAFPSVRTDWAMTALPAGTFNWVVRLAFSIEGAAPSSPASAGRTLLSVRFRSRATALSAPTRAVSLTVVPTGWSTTERCMAGPPPPPPFPPPNPPPPATTELVVKGLLPPVVLVTG